MEFKVFKIIIFKMMYRTGSSLLETGSYGVSLVKSSSSDGIQKPADFHTNDALKSD